MVATHPGAANREVEVTAVPTRTGGYWQIVRAVTWPGRQQTYVADSPVLQSQFDAAARVRLGRQATQAEAEAVRARADDARSPHCSRLDDATLTAAVRRGLDRDYDSHPFAAIGGVELIVRRLRAAGVSDPWDAANEEARRLDAVPSRAERAAARKRLDYYLAHEAQYRGNGHDIDAMIAEARQVLGR